MKNNIIKNLFFVLILGSILGGGCRKDINEYVLEDATTHTQTGRNLLSDSTAWFTQPVANAPVNQIFDALADPRSQVALAVANPMGQLIRLRTPDDVLVTINPGMLTGFVAGGGEVIFRARSIMKKGDFVRYLMPTASNGLPLISGGSVEVLAIQNGRELGLSNPNGLQIQVPAANNQPNQQMQLFTADSTRNVNWQPADSSRANMRITSWLDSLRNPATVVGYQVFSNRFRWINCDYFWNVSRTEMCVSIQDSATYTPQNTAVFAVYTNTNSVLRLYPNAQRRMWCGQLPAGQAVTFVTLSKINENYFLGTQTVGVTAIPTVSIVPVQRTLQQIIDYLGTL